MALERRDPVPAGRYSVFIRDAEEPRWQAWTAANPTVRVVASVQKRAVGGGELSAIFHVDTDGNIIWENVGSSLLFDLTAPTPWVGLGFPTIENRPLEAWAKEETENPEYIPEPTPLDSIRNIVLAAGALYLAGAFVMSRGRR